MAEREVLVPRVKLGSQGFEVSQLGFGCLGLTGIYNAPLSEEDGISILKCAFNKGITFFDTAYVYGANSNEILLGKALKHLPREKVQIATKFGIVRVEASGMVINGTPEYVRSCCEASLKRLGLDYIDLYYQHRVDTSIPIEETMGELKKLVEEEKVKYVGLSEASPDTIRRAHAVHPITTVQMDGPSGPVILRMRLSHFAGKAVVESIPPNSMLNLEKNKNIYYRVEELSKKHGCSPSQLALAWVLHQGDDVVPIPGTTKIKNLDANIGSLAVKLTEEDLKEISDAVPIEEVAGSRTHENISHQSWQFANTPLKGSKVSL